MELHLLELTDSQQFDRTTDRSFNMFQFIILHLNH